MGLRGGEGSGVTDDDFARNRLKRGAEVLHGFDHQKAQGGRLNAKCADLHQIKHLAGLGDDQNINALHAQNGSGTEAVGDAAQDGAVAGIAASDRWMISPVRFSGLPPKLGSCLPPSARLT